MRIIVVFRNPVKPTAARIDGLVRPFSRGAVPVDRSQALKQNVATMPIQHWLLKTEPSEFAFEDLVAKGRVTWDGISNPLALKHLRSTRAGDLALIYHTGDERSAVGIARILTAPYPDPKRNAPPRSVVVDIEPVTALPRPVSLQDIKADPQFKGFDLLRISRLSVVPVSAQHWKILMKMSGAKSPRA